MNLRLNMPLPYAEHANLTNLLSKLKIEIGRCTYFVNLPEDKRFPELRVALNSLRLRSALLLDKE